MFMDLQQFSSRLFVSLVLLLFVFQIGFTYIWCQTSPEKRSVPLISASPNFGQVTRSVTVNANNLSTNFESNTNNFKDNTNTDDKHMNGFNIHTSRESIVGSGNNSSYVQTDITQVLNESSFNQAKIASGISNISINILDYSASLVNNSRVFNSTLSGRTPLCPLVPPGLLGELTPERHDVNLSDIADKNPGLRPGGRHSPSHCRSRHRVAIVIPYRDRLRHLKILLNNLHPMLIRQQLDYGIFVIDQAPSAPFNRAMLMNIGFIEAMKRYNFQCTIFHDVDLLPENDLNIYSCPEQPRHLSSAVDKFNYSLPYQGIFGGVTALKKSHFEQVNGYSNAYFGWGGEDDDMFKRITSQGMNITRYPIQYSRYTMISHDRDKNNEDNPDRFTLLSDAESRMNKDGLNTLNYTVLGVHVLPTHILIKVNITDTQKTEDFSIYDTENFDRGWIDRLKLFNNENNYEESNTSKLYDTEENLSASIIRLSNNGLWFLIKFLVVIVVLEVVIITFLLRKILIRDLLALW